MPGTTPNLGFHYLLAADAPDLAGATYQLAIDLDTALTALIRRDTAWTAYTPGGSSAYAITNLGSSSGTASSSTWYWRYSGGEIEVAGGVVLGSTSSGCFGDVTMGLPVTAVQHAGAADVIGELKLIDAGTNVYPGVIGMVSTTAVYFRAPSVSGSHITESPLSSTNPFTWGSGDSLVARFRYTPAS